MSIDSLPNASAAQIKAMNKAAQEKFGIEPDEIIEQETKVAPILQHHEEPSMQIQTDDSDLHGEDEADDSAVEMVQDKESNKEYNMRILREKAEKAERERDEMMRQILAFQQQQQPKVQEPIETEEDYLASLGIEADSLAEGKHLKPLMKELRSLKNELNQYKRQTVQDTIEVRLKSRFPDFDSVVNQSNLEMLRNANPVLAEAILATPDQFKQATLAYEMVKQYGIYKDTSYDQDKIVAQKNAAKPRPLASVSPQQGESPMSKANAFANGLTADLKAQLLKEMNQHKKGY
jgi:hypothetical protein